MAEGTYWNGKRWVSAAEMTEQRRAIRGKPVQRVNPPPKPEKTDDKEQKQ